MFVFSGETLSIDSSFVGKKIVILGLARQGLALARFFVQQGAQVTISDAAPQEKLQSDLAKLGDLPVQRLLGGHPLSLLEGCDLLCLSGGVPPQIELVQTAIAQGIPLSNDSLLTLQLAKARGLGPTVAITGSSGKTTTTTLVGKMLEASGKRVHVGGNIGTPLIDRLDQIQPGDVLVLELSSFQLELFDPALAFGDFVQLGPDVAAILNITPNHLDRHPSMAAYAAAKFNLFRHLHSASQVVISADDPVTGSIAGVQGYEDAEGDVSVRGQLEARDVPDKWALEPLLTEIQSLLTALESPPITFSRQQALTTGAWLEGDTLIYNKQPICQRNAVRLRGDHNVSNLLAAAAISGTLGATVAGMNEVASTFNGVPHRLEIVAEHKGVLWVNDSIATSPERAIAGLRSFDPQQQTLILLAGGKDKNLPWELFADEILQRVNYLIGFGQAGPMIADMVHTRAAYQRIAAPSCAVAQRLDEAVMLAGLTARPGSVILLSPGGTSYDAYRDFEERGEHFRQLVRQQMQA